jgi:hypothetical protein
LRDSGSQNAQIDFSIDQMVLSEVILDIIVNDKWNEWSWKFGSMRDGHRYESW